MFNLEYLLKNSLLEAAAPAGTVVEILKSAVGTVADKKDAKNADIEGQI